MGLAQSGILEQRKRAKRMVLFGSGLRGKTATWFINGKDP